MSSERGPSFHSGFVRRLMSVAALTAVAFAASSAPTRWVARADAALACGANSLHFAVALEEHTNAVRGGSAKIEFINEQLCSTAGVASFSSYWASVIGISAGGGVTNKIYQIGIDECKGAACPAGNPVNTPYYFYAYGRDASANCTEIGPEPVAFGGAPGSGLSTFTIQRIPAPGGGYFYEAKQGGIQRNFRPESNLQTCWGGVDAAEIGNEVLNVKDQNGGPDSNRQNFENPLWHNGSSWMAITRPAGGNCDILQQPPDLSSGCRWATDGSAKWWSWDTRFP